MRRKRHWLDEIAQELWEELHMMAGEGASFLSGDVPLGSVESTPAEQVATFASLTPEQHIQLRAEIGDEGYIEYADNMLNTMRDELGPLAPYVMGDVEQLVEQVLQAPLQEPPSADQFAQEEV